MSSAGELQRQPSRTSSRSAVLQLGRGKEERVLRRVHGSHQSGGRRRRRTAVRLCEWPATPTSSSVLGRSCEFCWWGASR